MFSVSLVNVNGNNVFVYLALENTELASLLCTGFYDLEYNQCSITVVTECSAGAEVRNVCNYPTCLVFGDNAYNVFSGVFLSNIN